MRSPGFASTSQATSCEPSSWISNAPSRKSGSRLRAGRSLTRMPQGERRQACALMPFSLMFARASSRVILKWVDTQIERCRGEQGAHFAREAVAKTTTQAGFCPSGTFAGNDVGACPGEAACDLAVFLTLFVRLHPSWRVHICRHRKEPRFLPISCPLRDADRPRAAGAVFDLRAALFKPPVEARLMPQDAIDLLRNSATILRPDIAM